MGWLVRRATELDAEAVRDVAIAGWRDTYAGLLASETIEAFLAGPYALENVRRRIERHELLVALDAGEIRAFADAVAVAEPERLALLAIYATPARRRSGAGSALLAELARRHPNLPIDADVLLGNRLGEGFYERSGFEPVETIETELFGETVTERRWRRPAAGERPT